jgi:lipopolysaccharide export system protein LptA
VSRLAVFGDKSTADSGNLNQVGAVDVTIPKFSPDGNIIWTLEAKQVTPSDSSTYDVQAPNLKMRSSANRLSNAKSASGMFDMSKGRAWGDSTLEVTGDGYVAKGKKWLWNEKTELGSHQMTFNSDAYVYFQSALDPILDTPNKNFKKPLSQKPVLNKTTAVAKRIEFLSIEEEGYRFFLDGNVEVTGEALAIACQQMEILIESDRNGSQGMVGKISYVNAVGRVRLDQAGRICYADSLVLDTVEGTGLLSGNARVEDTDWGVVVGEKIELDRETGRAKVIGGENERASVEFQNLGEVRLPGLKKPKKKDK